MDLDLTDDQELLRETTARFIQDTCPLTTVRQIVEGGDGPGTDYTRQGAELGWFALLVPEDLGGGSVSGNGVLDATVVAEERGKFLQPGAFVATNVVAAALAANGTDDQKAKVLPAIIAGETVATWALADATGAFEPGKGVTARAAGSGFVLSGSKALVVDASQAEWILVAAATDGGLTQFLVATSTPGVRVEARQGLDLTRHFDQVRFDDAEVPASAVVGDVDGAADALERQFQLALVLSLAESVGAMDHLFQETLQYAKDRTAFGRPIGSFQAIKHSLADTSLNLEASKGLAVAAAKVVQAESEDAAEVVSMAKAFIGDCGVELAQNCFQVFGGIGFTWEHDNHLYLRRLTADASLYGEPAWHRERICQIHEL
jgi:alkylation response protein AidB-like acyl-CoA dehydrogenase